MLERVGNEHEALLEADRPAAGDALDDEVARVLDRGEGARVCPAGGTVKGRRRLAVQGLVWPLVVVEAAERVKSPLLSNKGRAGRANGLALQSFCIR
jgi:hypothetical protein